MNISFWKEKGSKYIVFILIGLLILVMCIPTGTNKSQLLQIDETGNGGELESRLEQVLSSMEGVGSVKVMITTETKTEKVCGVVVVAEGAGNAVINARISEAVKALFSIDVHKISIVKMRSQEARSERKNS